MKCFYFKYCFVDTKTRKCYYSNEFSANTCNADDANNEAYKKINSDNSNDGNFLIKINR